MIAMVIATRLEGLRSDATVCARVGRGEPKGTIIEIGVAIYRGIVRNACHNLYSRALRKLRRGLWDFGDETMRAQLCVEQFGAAV